MSAAASTASTSTTTAYSSMTRHELMTELSHMKSRHRNAQLTLDRFESRMDRLQRKMETYHVRLQKFLKKNPDANPADMTGETFEMIQHEIRWLTDSLEGYRVTAAHHRRAVEELERLTSLSERSAPVASNGEKAGSITLYVRLLSGDLKTVTVERALPVAHFADAFVEQTEYSSTATSRFVFLYSQQENKEEDIPVFWSPEERHEGLTVGDLIREQEVASLDLIIRPLDDPERNERMSLVRSILEKEGRRCAVFTEDDLFGLYSTWILTYKTPAGSNRYLKTKAFIEAHLDVFTILTPEEEVQEERARRLEKFRIFRKQRVDDILERRERLGAAIVNPQGITPDLVRRWHERHGAETPIQREAMLYLLRLFTMDELIEGGLTPASFPDGILCQHYRRFVADWQELSAAASMPFLAPK